MPSLGRRLLDCGGRSEDAADVLGLELFQRHPVGLSRGTRGAG